MVSKRVFLFVMSLLFVASFVVAIIWNDYRFKEFDKMVERELFIIRLTIREWDVHLKNLDRRFKRLENLEERLQKLEGKDE